MFYQMNLRFIQKQVIKKIIGVDEAKSINGVQRVEILKGIGEEATPLRKSSDRLGLVIAQGDTAEEAIAIAEEALEKIDFIVE